MRVEFKDSVDVNEIVYLDKVSTRGEPIFSSDSYCSYMEKETDWPLSDPRFHTQTDPDGDGIKNLFEYAFQSPPHIAGHHVIVKERSEPVLPQWRIAKDGSMEMRYRQLAQPSMNRSSSGVFRVGDLVYGMQTSDGELSPWTGDWSWYSLNPANLD